MNENKNLSFEIEKLKGPILILGASGFVGANLFHMINKVRSDVFGTTSRLPAWRLSEDTNDNRIIKVDLTSQYNLHELLEQVNPCTIFDCMAYGAYSFEGDVERIYQTNLAIKINLVEELVKRKIYCYLHAGSSSEYGENSNAPGESVMLTPNSHYSVTKCAMSDLLYFTGKYRGLRCANLRLYSAYGPLEDSARLIPVLIQNCLDNKLPPLVDADISRDFIYVDDVCEAFILTANNLLPNHYGESFNIGTAQKTTIRELITLAKDIFNISEEPIFSSMQARNWDTVDWYANTDKASAVLGWRAHTSLKQGLLNTTQWYKELPNKDEYKKLSKQNFKDFKYSITAVVACYKDAHAIPIMVDRLTKVFETCQVDYEIILVNDCSPDNSIEVILEESRKNVHVIGITHSRNFGSQAAFKSGMEIASKNACVLLDGDLQDPPELIIEFLKKWRDGYDVVYGVRVKREASFIMQVSYKLFYRIFDKFSIVKIPYDAGDFSLIDRSVVAWLLKCKERDIFLRGLRAYVGFKQTGVDYIRPERMFGVTTNSLVKNIGWAKKGIFSFSRVPLDILTTVGLSLVMFTIFLSIFQIGMHIFAPQSAPKGITTLMLLIMFLGSFTIFSISVIGEYIAKIFEEVKKRPLFIRKSIIKKGKELPFE
ncbi:MAG TPA: NAD-dependent epimerase/dehydratase family protein [Aquella sp.]|nr:NAD-dependent epimerase/dehydratase family protein [Aquella sp.]